VFVVVVENQGLSTGYSENIKMSYADAVRTSKAVDEQNIKIGTRQDPIFRSNGACENTAH
jgi:hypothetical protein